MRGLLRFAWVAVALGTGLRGVEGAPPQSVPTRGPGPMLRRMLDGAMKGVEEIVFAVRVPGHDHWYVTFGNYSDRSTYPKDRAFKYEDGVYWGYGEGARLCRLNLRTGQLRVLLEDPRGGIRDPQVHYDGRKILFAYRKGGTHSFHLYEIGVDGDGLRQLTDGPDDDIEPTYCPDGSIVFCSSRCQRFVNCWYTRVAVLYRCDGDGANVRMLSSNNDHDNTPWVLPDGRVLYMRWEYVDRSQVHFHHLWTMNPDGSGQTVYYGNMHGGISMLDAKPIPGTRKVVASFSPGHGRPEHVGFVTVVDPVEGPDALGRARNISKRPEWKDPYAFSEGCFLVAKADGLYVMDGQGNAERFYELPSSDRSRLQCSEPRPLCARPRERVIPDRTDLTRDTGTLILQDIYEGRRMEGVKAGEVAKLLVLKQLPKPVNFSGGMQPLTIGGSFTLAEILGTVPVERDGSANMRVPALQSLFFVALDKENRPIKRMHSFATVGRGETLGCVGCHENRIEAPVSSSAPILAMGRPASAIEPLEGIPAVIDFPRDVQPILDRNCVRCHNADDYKARMDLSGDKTGRYTMSYRNLIVRRQINDARNRVDANDKPYSYGSVVSPLMAKIDGSHHGVKVTPHERDLVRLWIETSGCYPGTYAALGHPDVYPGLPYKRMEQSCGGCHKQTRNDTKGKPYTLLVFRGGTTHELATTCNISRPAKSTILRAPLAKAAGGLQLCKDIVFKDTNDPLYKEMLLGIGRAHERLTQVKRFDMKGFRPNEHYIREMQRFGFIPKDLPDDAPVDVYAVDRAYWDSFPGDLRPGHE